jgi:hypothetical protein
VAGHIAVAGSQRTRVSARPLFDYSGLRSEDRSQNASRSFGSEVNAEILGDPGWAAVLEKRRR